MRQKNITLLKVKLDKNGEPESFVDEIKNGLNDILMGRIREV